MKLRTVLLLMLVLGANLFAKTIYYGKRPVSAVIPWGKTSVLIFDKDVRSIDELVNFEIKTMDDGITINKTFEIRPKRKNIQEDISILFNDNSYFKLKVKAINSRFPEVQDDTYKFEAKDVAVSENSYEQKVGNNEIVLMKAALQGHVLKGYKKLSFKRELKDGHKDITTSLRRVYLGNMHNAYVYKIFNKSNKPIFVDVKDIKVGNPDQGNLSFTTLPMIPPGMASLYFTVSTSSTSHLDINFKVKRFDDVKEEVKK